MTCRRGRESLAQTRVGETEEGKIYEIHYFFLMERIAPHRYKHACKGTAVCDLYLGLRVVPNLVRHLHICWRTRGDSAS